MQASCSVPQNLLPISPALEQMWQQRKDAQIEESLNLLYVACTRAKYFLGMWCSPSKGESLTYADVVLGTVTSLQRGDLPARNFAQKEAITVVSKPTLTKILVAGDRRRALRVVSPSRAKEGIQVIPPSWKQREQSALYGTIMHTLLRHRRWNDEPLCSDEALHQYVHSIDPSGSHNEMVSHFKHIVMLSALEPVFSRTSYGDGAEVYTEKSFAVWNEQSQELVSGTFDRLVRYDNGSKIEILDFKTDADITSEAQLLNRYESQMALYRSSAAILFNLPESSVTSRLVLFSRTPLVTNNR